MPQRHDPYEPAPRDCRFDTLQLWWAPYASGDSSVVPPDFPALAAIFRAMSKLRAEGVSANPSSSPADPGNPGLFYAGPVLRVVDSRQDVIYEVLWDHSEAALDEAREIAARFRGCVYVCQDVYVFRVHPRGKPRIIDEGYQLEVWPRFGVVP